MFKKPVRIKSETQMKSSEKKKFQSQVLGLYPMSEDELYELCPRKEIVLVSKVCLSNNSVINIYSVNRVPLFFLINDKLYPSLYFIWKFPNKFPCFTVHQHLVQILMNGADLMLAGIVIKDRSDPNCYNNVNKGDICVVNSLDNHAPFAVGVAGMSSLEMRSAGQAGGRSVLIWHMYGDYLWSFKDKQPRPELGPAKFPGDLPDSIDSSETPINADNNQDKSNDSNDKVNDENIPLEELKIEENEVDEVAEKEEIDKVLEYSFIKGIKKGKNISLPISISKFQKDVMIPVCPNNTTLNFKKSSFKKLLTFLAHMAETGIIKVETLKTGIHQISHIKYDHELIQKFVDTRKEETFISTSEDSNKEGDKLAISEKYAVTKIVAPLFEPFLVSKGNTIDAKQLRKYVTEYIDMNNLKVAGNNSHKQNCIKLDLTLKQIVGDTPDGLMSWKDLMESIKAKLGNVYEVKNNTNMPIKQQKGKLPPIEMRTANRKGNKKVTLVNNLECYLIDLKTFSQECQRGCAASTTINDVPGYKCPQLQIQGNQILFVTDLLRGKYKIPLHQLRGLEFAPKKKN